jgi:predicted nucleic acid-binding protein
MTLIYLDTNVLVAYYATDPSEREKKELVEKALAVFDQLADVELCTSQWAVSEMVKVLVKTKRMDRGTVAEIASTLLRGKRLRNLKITLLDVSPRKNYDFDDFFVGVSETILTYSLDLADAIHSVIVQNHGIDRILSFDQNFASKAMAGCTVVHPKQIVGLAP